ncbi:MAG: glycosyltransferase [Thermoguttaceae bacterium]|nr:glycosyltransferase [Thermoguttaceae bacterium]
MRIKLLFVIPTLDRCGAEKQMTLIATNLPRDRFEVHVAVLTRNGPYSEDLRKAGIPFDIIGKKSKFSPSAYYRLKKLIKRIKPDIVHTWLFAANSYGRKAAFSCGVPVVVCGERCVDPWKSAWQGWIDRQLEPQTSAYAVNSSGVVDFYIKRGIPREKFVVIPNAVETPDIFDFNKNDLKKDLLKELDLSRTPELEITSEKDAVFHEMNISGANGTAPPELPYLIGLVARFWPQKRIKDALWAADQVKFAQLNFYLIVLGDGPEREALLRYRDDLQIGDRVVMLGERNDVSRFMPCFDVLWNCSAYEGQSNSILEAQSFGIPVIASDVPGNRDLVETGKTGVLIPEFAGDETRRRTALSSETIRLLSEENRDLRRRLGQAAQKRVREEFSLQKAVERHASMYEQLLSQLQK